MTTHTSNSSPDRVLRPRPVKPVNPDILRTQKSAESLRPGEFLVSGGSSGRSTPIPADAPPSVQSLSSAKKQARAQAKHRIFHTINYTPRVSHFDRTSEYNDFRGFFVLFWVSLFILVLTTGLRNIKETGHPLRIVWLGFWVELPFFLHWTWTAQVFFILHTLVIFMKMHSYVFYNGHLSETERRLHSLDRPETASLAAAVRYPSSPTRPKDHNSESEEEKDRTKEAQLSGLRTDLAGELTSPLGQVTYPHNLTYANYADFIFCPTLCYELEYPRVQSINWMELFWKVLAVFGCIFLLIITSEDFIVPVLAESAVHLKSVDRFFPEKALILAETISWLLFPFMVIFLLVFLVIFEYLLGAFAEVTRFADRHFYSDWWNSADWLEFSREWNVPVHHFLRRHVYFSSRSYFSNGVAMFITFLVSAFGHELIMGCITKKLRGYGFVAMMLQLPIVAVQRSKYVRGNWIFNNATFWASMILGLSIMCALYVLV
ncbi:putative sterol o-acyltransferase [Phaeomoniella chlamydospora]|uniref:O-acyltransferase n=1 Tax=Phaeomoniella chlamydospora TaxID=158046 RepID=A0A0G2EDL1_PHACM|nr:putative sterol o-acyltransferase [Phaeomoniella chlamydospora]